MNNLARRLIAEERRVAGTAGRPFPAGFQVCEKLRAPLCTFAGVAGYRALISRAVVLARANAPLLEGMQIKPDGSFIFSAELEARLATDEAAQAGSVLANQLLELLITFIGEALTLRLTQDIWPKAATPDPKSKEKQT
jgi:hypothetical protein